MNLGGCHGNYNIMGVQNSSKFMLLLGSGVHMHLLWIGLISIIANDSKFASFWVFQGLSLLLVWNKYCRVEIHFFPGLKDRKLCG